MLDMIKVKDGTVTVLYLPTTGTLESGETVSNYQLLPQEILIAEGWLPRVEDIPVFNEDTEDVQIERYEILSDKVIVHYVVVQKDTVG